MEKKILILIIIMATIVITNMKPINAAVWSNFSSNLTIEVKNTNDANSHQDELIVVNVTGLSFGPNGGNCTTGTLLADNQSTTQINRTILADGFNATSAWCRVAFKMNNTLASNGVINYTFFYNNTNSSISNQTLNRNNTIRFWDDFERYTLGSDGNNLTLVNGGEWSNCSQGSSNCGKNMTIVGGMNGKGMNLNAIYAGTAPSIDFNITPIYTTGNLSMRFILRLDDNSSFRFGFVNSFTGSSPFSIRLVGNLSTGKWTELGGNSNPNYFANGTNNITITDIQDNQSFRYYHGNFSYNDTQNNAAGSRAVVDFQGFTYGNITIDEVLVWEGNGYGINTSAVTVRNTTLPAVAPANSGPSIKTLVTVPSYPKYNQITFVQTNITDASTFTANVTINYPNGTAVATNSTTNFSLQLLNFVADQANSTKHQYNVSGVYNVTVFAVNSAGGISTKNITFVIPELSGGSTLSNNSNISGNSNVSKNSQVSDSIIDNSNITDSNVSSGSVINGSNITSSVISSSNIYLSNISFSNVTNSNITQSDVNYCDVQNSQIINSSLWNCTVITSDIFNVTWNNEDGIVTFKNSNITNNVLYSGNITWRGYLFDTGKRGVINITRAEYATFIQPQNTSFTPDPAYQNFSINYTIFQLSSNDVTIAVNITKHLNITYWTTNFTTYVFAINFTKWNSSNPFSTTLNITATSYPANSTYSMETTFNTSVQTKFIENMTSVDNLTVHVDPPAGDVDASASNGTLCFGAVCDNDTTMKAGESISLNFQLNNTGGFVLSDCHQNISGWSDTSFVSFSLTDAFTIAINQSISETVTYKPQATTPKQTGKLEIDCKANANGGRNKLTSDPDNAPDLSLIVNPSLGGGTGGGGAGGGGSYQPTPSVGPLALGALCTADSMCSTGICDLKSSTSTSRVCLASTDLCGNGVCNDGIHGIQRGETLASCQKDCAGVGISVAISGGFESTPFIRFLTYFIIPGAILILIFFPPDEMRKRLKRKKQQEVKL